MDPRLNPNLTPAPRLMQDIKATAPNHSVQAIEGPNPSASNNPPTNLPVRPDDSIQTPISVPLPTTNVVESIPVHQQSPELQSQSAAIPVVQMPGPSIDTPPEDDLDKILQAVNSRVSAPQSSLTPKAKAAPLSKILGKAKKFKLPSNPPRTIVAMGVVVIIAIGLSVVAVMAYHQGQQTSALTKQPGKVGTSYTASASIQAAGGTLVRPSDLDDYSQTLSQKLNGLNDTQDFDSASLSDATLGL